MFNKMMIGKMMIKLNFDYSFYAEDGTPVETRTYKITNILWDMEDDQGIHTERTPHSDALITITDTEEGFDDKCLEDKLSNEIGWSVISLDFEEV